MADLKGRRIALLATDGVEQVELTEPAEALRNAGARVDVISPKAGTIQGMNHDERGDSLGVDVVLKDAAQAIDYDGLLLPGGVANPDTLRTSREAVKFVEAFVAADKPIAAICSRTLDAHQRRRGQGKAHDFMAFAAAGPDQCRR
jgi:protease I